MNKNFWEWVEGIELRTIPVLRAKIVCMEECTPAVEWGGCLRCLGVLEQSGLKSALEAVHWEADFLRSQVCFGMQVFWSAHANLT